MTSEPNWYFPPVMTILNFAFAKMHHHRKLHPFLNKLKETGPSWTQPFKRYGLSKIWTILADQLKSHNALPQIRSSMYLPKIIEIGSYCIFDLSHVWVCLPCAKAGSKPNMYFLQNFLQGYPYASTFSYQQRHCPEPNECNFN